MKRTILLSIIFFALFLMCSVGAFFCFREGENLLKHEVQKVPAVALNKSIISGRNDRDKTIPIPMVADTVQKIEEYERLGRNPEANPNVPKTDDAFACTAYSITNALSLVLIGYSRKLQKKDRKRKELKEELWKLKKTYRISVQTRN